MSLKSEKVHNQRGEGGKKMGKIGQDPLRNMCKGHMDKAKAWFEGGRWGWVGQGAEVGENGDSCT